MKALTKNSYTNKYATYIDDTIAGIPGILPGAGFMYRKMLGKGGA